MKKLIIAASILVLLTITGCTENKDNTQTDTADAKTTTPSISPPAKMVLFPAVPKILSGHPFKLGGKCALGTINNARNDQQTTSIKRADGLTVFGWAFDDKNGSVPGAVGLQLVSKQERYHSLLLRQGNRDDLVKAFGKAEYAGAGFYGVIDIVGLPKGKYDVLILQLSGDKNLVCSTHRKLVLSD